MDFVDSAGTRYQLVESAEAPAPTKKTPVWPWVVGGLALAGGLVWMASANSRKTNPINPDTEALILEARDPGTSRDRLVELVNHSEVEVRRALLDNPNVCPTKADGKLDTSLLGKLAEAFPEEVAAHSLFVLHALIEPNDEMLWVVMKVVERTSDVGLIKHVLRTWGSVESGVRQSVARNPRTPVDVLRILGNETTEEEWWVRKAVAQNPKTPEDVIRIMGNEKTESEWNVRQAVATNPRTPEDVLRALGNPKIESVWAVRLVVAQNPSTPEDLLRTLDNPKTESKWDVRQAAQKALAERGLV